VNRYAHPATSVLVEPDGVKEPPAVPQAVRASATNPNLARAATGGGHTIM
jgi:hypothetical protein